MSQLNQPFRVFNPSPNSPNPYLNLLSTYLKPQRWRVILMTVLLFIGIGLQLWVPQLLRTFIDAFGNNTGHVVLVGIWPMGLLPLALIFISTAVAQQLVSVAATYTSESVAWTATNELRADLSEHCMRLDMPFHNAHTPGEMIERIDGDVSALASFFSQFIIQIIGNGLLLLGVLVLLLREEWRIGLMLTGFVILAMALLIGLRRITIPWWAAERQAFADLWGFIEERLSGTEDIRSSGSVPYVLLRYYQLMRTTFRAAMKAVLGFNMTLNLTWIIFAIGTAIAFLLSALFYQQGALTLGAVYLVFSYATLLQQPVDHITRELEGFQQASASIGRIRGLLELQPQINDGRRETADGLSRPPSPASVHFNNVSFAYDSNAAELVLKQIEFCLQPGRTLGLLGRTGSGKTTLARLLFRLYEVTDGAIRLDDIDIRELPLTELRDRVGMVTQDVQLFHATVRDNLTFFDPNISDAHILQVIDDLGLRSWYDALAHGLDTELQAGNAGLSAGEAQLLAFTRVFLHDPRLVILDEATSRLDRATEQLIERAIDKLLADHSRTAIIIAHRLSTVQRTDEIIILADGQIIEHGDRLVLATDPTTRFAQLLKVGMEQVLV